MRLAPSHYAAAATVSSILLAFSSCSCRTPSVDAFVPISSCRTAAGSINAAGRTVNAGAGTRSVGKTPPLTVLNAKQKKKRRRKRKVDPSAAGAGAGASIPSAPAAPEAAAAPPPAPVAAAPAAPAVASSETKTADLKAAEMAAASASQFDLAADGAFVPVVEDDVDEASSLPLPDIREARARRQERQELEEEAKIQQEFRPRVDRKDLEAMKRLLEAEPFADADESFFEEEEYGTVSALLGEKAKPFLGIGSGPLQVGHFIGSLAIMLMAFVEYPGFPLTNLPTPLRECLQGGLGTIYAINVVLAVVATFKAGERAQSPLLWGVKTVAVGGLAFDQLSQLPTTAEVERRKSIKGKRALGNNKKR